jgi:predicted RND superfamily exporter protein
MKRILLSALVVIITIFAFVGVVQIKFNSDPRFLLSDMELLNPTLKEWSKDFGEGDRECQVLVEAEDCLAPETLHIIQKMATRLRELGCVESILSPLDLPGRDRTGQYLFPLIPISLDADLINQRREEIETHPLIAGQLLSGDQKRMLILISLVWSCQEPPALYRSLDTLQGVLHEVTQGSAVRASLTGAPAIQVAIHKEMRRDQLRFNIIGLSLSCLLAVLVFSSLGAAVMAGTAPSIGVLWTMGIVGFCGIDLNIMNSVLPLMILVIGYTDSVHILLHVRNSLQQGISQPEAVRKAVRVLWMPCLMTSLTTATGFASLTISRIPVLREFGLVGAVGCLVNFAAVIMVLPLLALTPLGQTLVKRRLKDTYDRISGEDNMTGFSPVRKGLLTSAIVRIGRFSDRRHVPVSIFGLVLVFVSVFACLQLTSDNRIKYNLPDTSESFKAFQEIDEHFGGVMMIHAMVQWPDQMSMDDEHLLNALVSIDRALEKHPIVSHPLSVLDLLEILPSMSDQTASRIDDPLKEIQGKSQWLSLIPESLLGRFINRGSRKVVVMGHVPDSGTDLLMSTIIDLQGELDRIRVDYPRLHIELTGQTVVGTQLFSKLMKELGQCLLLAGIIIFLFLLLAVRSFPMALLAVIPNAFAIAGTGAVIVLLGESFQYVSVLAITICLGIAVDDTIHFMVRFQRLRKDKSLDDRYPIQATVHQVGLPILMASVIFIVGFGTVAFSKIPTLKTFSWLACASITLAFVGDLILLPGLLRLTSKIGRRGRISRH